MTGVLQMMSLARAEALRSGMCAYVLRDCRSGVMHVESALRYDFNPRFTILYAAEPPAQCTQGDVRSNEESETMKLKAYDQTEQSEPTIRLRLVQDADDDDVLVIAVNPEGKMLHAGSLIRFKFDGTVRLFGCVGPGIGFQLDKRGRIRVTEG